MCHEVGLTGYLLKSTNFHLRVPHVSSQIILPNLVISISYYLVSKGTTLQIFPLLMERM